MIDATNILQLIALGVSGWALLELIALKTQLARIEQKLDDLPCQTCPEPAQARARLRLSPEAT